MSAARHHGPYVLQDGPTRKFWREVSPDGEHRGEWVLHSANAERYPTRAEAERGRASLAVGVGHANLGRVHVVAVSDLQAAAIKRHTAATTAPTTAPPAATGGTP